MSELKTDSWEMWHVLSPLLYQFNCPNPYPGVSFYAENEFFKFRFFFLFCQLFFLVLKSLGLILGVIACPWRITTKNKTNDYELLCHLYWGSQEPLVERVQALSNVGLGSNPDTLSVSVSSTVKWRYYLPQMVVVNINWNYLWKHLVQCFHMIGVQKMHRLRW